MDEKTLTKTELQYLCEKPGIQLIKAGTYQMKEVSEMRGMPGLKSQIVDVPLTSKTDVVTLGYYAYQPSESYEAFFNFIEVKIVVKGKMVVRDVEGNKYVAEAGDVLIFSPDTTVIFDGESDGEVVYFKHTLPNPAYLV